MYNEKGTRTLVKLKTPAILCVCCTNSDDYLSCRHEDDANTIVDVAQQALNTSQEAMRIAEEAMRAPFDTAREIDDVRREYVYILLNCYCVIVWAQVVLYVMEGTVFLI